MSLLGKAFIGAIICISLSTLGWIANEHLLEQRTQMMESERQFGIFSAQQLQDSDHSFKSREYVRIRQIYAQP